MSNALVVLEGITLLVDLYYKYSEMEGLTDEEKDKRLHKAVFKKRSKKADDLPDV